MDKQTNSNKDTDKTAKNWTKEEQKKIDEALRQAELEEEIERKLREKRWSASGSDKNNAN